MNNQTKKPQDPGQLLAPMDEEHFHNNCRSAIDYYGKYLDKRLHKIHQTAPLIKVFS